VIRTLEGIGRIAVELHAAQFETKEARRRYYARCRRYIDCFTDGILNAGEPEFHRVTKVPYEAFIKARKHEYNIKRRLGNAIRSTLNVTTP